MTTQPTVNQALTQACTVLFDTLLRQSSNPVFLLSAEGHIVEFNAAARSLYGIEQADVLNQDYFEVCQQFGIRPVSNSMAKLLQKEHSPQITTTIKNAAHTKTIQWNIFKIPVDQAIAGLCFIGTDISHLFPVKGRETNLQSTIIDLLPQHYIFWKDINSVYLGCNKTFANSLNFADPNDIIGKSDYDLPVNKADSDAYVLDDQQVMRSGIAKLNIEEPQRLTNGETRYLLTSKVPLINESQEVYGILAIYSDITEQKINEQKLVESNQKLKQAYLAKSEFIRNISHDIYTPLSGIQQASLMISEGSLSEAEVPEYAYSAWEASGKLMDLFKQIIDVSKKEHFEFEDNIAQFDMDSLLHDLTKTYEIVAKHKKLKLEIVRTKQVPRYLIGKHLRLHRVLMNLLGNALKFTDTGHVKLRVKRLRTLDKTGKAVLEFTVADSGIGIPKEKFDVIFEPFQRLAPTYQSQYSGSGLGLHVVKDYVTKLDGEVFVESKPGKGSTFKCIIPFEQISGNAAVDLPAAPYPEQSIAKDLMPKQEKSQPLTGSYPVDNLQHTSRHSILLVEDDKLVRNMSAIMLRKIPGCQLDTAVSGEAALTLTLKKSYDLIFMDIGLPGIDGIETVKHIRQHIQNLSQHAYIIALTAHADEQIKQACLAAGMQHILFKGQLTENLAEINELLTALPLDTANQVVNWALWLKRVSQNAALAEEAFHMLAEELTQNRQDIKGTYQQRDWAQLRSVLHKMKGGLAFCGLPQLEHTVNALSIAVKSKHANEIKKQYNDCLLAIDAVERAYYDWLKNKD